MLHLPQESTARSGALREPRVSWRGLSRARDRRESRRRSHSFVP
jgi:hypothetical protein